jgi:hypothetical protein
MCETFRLKSLHKLNRSAVVLLIDKAHLMLLKLHYKITGLWILAEKIFFFSVANFNPRVFNWTLCKRMNWAGRGKENINFHKLSETNILRSYPCSIVRDYRTLIFPTYDGQWTENTIMILELKCCQSFWHHAILKSMGQKIRKMKY